MGRVEKQADLGELLLQSVREMKAGKRTRETHVSISWVVQVRHKTGLSQSDFATLLGVSARTIQDWEQGRREPSGAAQSLLRIADKHPEVFAELATGAAQRTVEANPPAKL